MNALKKLILHAIPLALASLTLLNSQPLRAQSGTSPQFLFAAQDGNPPTVTTYSVNQTTGALTIPAGVSPAPIRIAPPVQPPPFPPFARLAQPHMNQSAVVNPAGTFLFVAGTNTNNNSAVSVLSISATGALAELAASPFSAADATFPMALAISPDGQYLYELSENDPSKTNSSVLDVFSIASDGTPTPLRSYTAFVTTMLYMHPTGQWLYAFGGSNPNAPNFQQFTIGPPGVLTHTGSLEFGISGLGSRATALVGDAAGKYLFDIVDDNLQPNGVFGDAGLDTFSVDGNGGGLTWLNSEPSPSVPPNSNEAIDSTGRFLYTAFGNFSLSNGIPTFLPMNPPTAFSALLLASRTSPFLFGAGQSAAGTVFLSSDVIGSDGTLTAAPGSPYTGSNIYFALAVTGFVPFQPQPNLFLSTNFLDFVATAGRTDTSTVTLSSIGFSPLIFNSISVSGDASYTQINNCPNTLAVGSKCAVTVKFAPTAPGTFTGTLNITSNSSSSAFSVSLLGTGVPPAADPALTPATLTFPSTVVGVSSTTQPFTIENLPDATAPVQISSITIGGSNPNDFSQTNNCTTVLNAGQSCTITITFTPLAAGGRSATVTAMTNDSSVATLGGVLSGQGIATISVTQSQQTGAAGTTFTFPITEIGFTTQPSLTASCSIPAGTCTINGTNLVVTTTPHTSGIALRDFPRVPGSFALALAFLLLFASPGTRKIVRRLALVGSLAFLAACQTSGGGGMNSSGTPAGTYTVAIHATAGTQTSTTAVTVVVQ